MSVEITFDEFTRYVHSRRSANSSETLTDALMTDLKLVKPLLERAATSHVDPRVPPYQLTMWLAFVRNNWSAFDRPKTES